MPRSAGIVVENNFSKGLITEATGLSFPENACTETFDCIFKKTGEVTRRKGFEYESSYSLFTLTAARNNSAISSFVWVAAGGDGNTNFHVVQVGQYIYFYKMGDSLSDGKHATSIDLNSFDVTGSTNPYFYRCTFASGLGTLFVTGQYIEPFYVEYTPTTDTISSGTQISIQVRDFEGDTADTLGDTERPTATVTTDTAVINAHLYNLMNQGWAEKVFTDGTNDNPVKDWDAAVTTLPSNADRWWQTKNSSEQMDMGELDKYGLSTTRVPNGHFIFNAFDIDRSTATGSDATGGAESFDTLWGRGGLTNKASTLTTKSTDFRPTAMAFHANRVFYAGVNDKGFNSQIYFSQILTDLSKAGKCYQEQDPTDESLSDLLATDGGVIEIPEIGNVVFIATTKTDLVIFATNGIWIVTGSEGIGFSPTDFSVQKLSSTQNAQNKSYIDLNGIPAWVNSEGIWILQQDQTLGSNNVTSLSKDTIQTFFEDIPPESIRHIKGMYNARERIAYWLYRSTASVASDAQYEYDRVLCFNTETGAFYPWKLNGDTDIKIIDATVSFGFSEIVDDLDVLEGTDNVVDSGATQVTAAGTAVVAVAGTLKLFTVNTSDQVTFAESWDDTYLDWTIAKGTGKNYSSYGISGYKVRGDGIRKQANTYVELHSRVEENSSFFFQGLWGYATNAASNRWSSPQQGYRSQTNYTYTQRRLKVRGYGLALQFRFYSDEGAPFNITGWSTMDTVSNAP